MSFLDRVVVVAAITRWRAARGGQQGSQRGGRRGVPGRRPLGRVERSVRPLGLRTWNGGGSAGVRTMWNPSAALGNISMADAPSASPAGHPPTGGVGTGAGARRGEAALHGTNQTGVDGQAQDRVDILDHVLQALHML